MKEEISKKAAQISKDLGDLFLRGEIDQEQYNFVAERLVRLNDIIKRAEDSSLENLSRIMDSLVTTLKSVSQKGE